MTDLTSIVEKLAQQALNGGANTNQAGSGLGGILGSVLGQMGSGNQQSAQGGLGGILGSVLGGLGGGGTANSAASNPQSLLIMVLPFVLSWIQKQGGLQAALDQLKNNGLSSQVQGWVDPNQANPAVSPQNIQNLFDDQDVAQIAAQTQAPKQEIYGAIAAVLPQVIDSLTPQGSSTNPQEANNDIQNVLNMVSGFLK